LVNLEYLLIDSLEELREIPTGIKFLNSIKDAYFTRMHPDFILRMEKLDHWSAQGKFRSSNTAHIFHVFSVVKHSHFTVWCS
jgi:hypothetical protein